jgi:hypothetical protein
LASECGVGKGAPPPLNVTATGAEQHAHIFDGMLAIPSVTALEDHMLPLISSATSRAGQIST